MDQAKTIDYRVSDAKRFVGTEGSKDIDKINQKKSTFTFLGEASKFELELVLLVPAIVTMLEYKVSKVDQIQIDFYFQDNKVYNKAEHLSPKRKNGEVGIISLGQNSSTCDKVRLTLVNVPQPNPSEIHYLFLKGFKSETTAHKPKPKNLSKDDSEFKPSAAKLPAAEKHLAMFNDRRKKATPAELESQALMLPLKSDKKGREQKKQGNMDVELRRAIELSKKEEEKKKKEEKEIDEMFCDEFVDYELVEYSENMKRVYGHVSADWLQAQVKAEKNIKVLSRHSLGSKISIKVLKNCKYCINGIYGEEKKKLVQLIRDLGGQYLEQPQNNCIILSSRKQGDQINLAKSMKGTWIVLPSYLIDCQKMQTKLALQDYKLPNKW